jgi:hypothetical protein
VPAPAEVSVILKTGHSQNVVGIWVSLVYRGSGRCWRRERHMQRRGGHHLKDGPSHRESVCVGQTEVRREQQFEVEENRGIERRAEFVASGSFGRVSLNGKG